MTTQSATQRSLIAGLSIRDIAHELVALTVNDPRCFLKVKEVKAPRAAWRVWVRQPNAPRGRASFTIFA